MRNTCSPPIPSIRTRQPGSIARLIFLFLTATLGMGLLSGCGVLENTPELDAVRDSAEAAATRAAELAAEAAPAAQTAVAEARAAGTVAADTVAELRTRVPTIVADTQQSSAEVIGTAEALATEGAPATLVANAEAFTLVAADAAQTTLGPIFTIINNELGIVTPGGDGQTVVTVDEQLVNALIIAYVGQPAPEENQPLPSLSLTPRLDEIGVSITPEYVAIIGRLRQPVRTSFEFRLVPVVENGVLQFDLIDAQFGPVNAPGLIIDLTETAFNRLADTLTAQLPEGFVLNQVILGNGQMQLIGRFGTP